MSIEPQSQEEADKQKLLEKYAPDLDKIDLDLSGTGTAQPNVSPEIIEREEAREEQAIEELARTQTPDIELLDLGFLTGQESEEDRLFRIKFRQVVISGYMEGKSLDEIYALVDGMERSSAVDDHSSSLPLRDIASRIYRSAQERGGETQRCHICGKYNPRYEDNCPSFCPYSDSEGQS